MGISGVLQARLHAILLYYRPNLNFPRIFSSKIEAVRGIYLGLFFGNFKNPGLKRVSRDGFQECIVDGVGSKMVKSQR